MQVGSRWGALVAVLSVASVAGAQPNAPQGRAAAPATAAPPAPSSSAPSTGGSFAAAGAPASSAPSAPASEGAEASPPAEPPAGAPPSVEPSLPPPPMQTAIAGGASYGGAVPVWMVGDEGETALVSIYPDWTSEGAVAPLASCHLPCGFQMQPGRYRIQVAETETTLRGSRPVIIEGPSRLTITPRERAKRTAGLVLGIGGIVAVVAGIGLMIDGTHQQRCNGDFCRELEFDAEAGAGLAVFLAGAAITPIGWVLFGKSFRPAVDVEHGAPTAYAPYGRLGLVGVPGGAGLGGTFVF